MSIPKVPPRRVNKQEDRRVTSVPKPEPVEVPAGHFIYQNTAGTFLPTFHISKTPITNDQYMEFLQATRDGLPSFFKDKRFGILAKDRAGNYIGPELPVVGVTFRDAKAYAEWVGGRLPTEFEWEKAARGTDGNEYPCGSQYRLDDRIVAFNRDGTMPVDREGVERIASPYGVLDMAGNVCEWTTSLYEPGEKETLVLRGGAWNSWHIKELRSTAREGRAQIGRTIIRGSVWFGIVYGAYFRIAPFSPTAHPVVEFTKCTSRRVFEVPLV